MADDKQLRDVRLADVLEKRRLDQALNAKEFALCARVSYSIARGWFHLPGFPVFRGVIFWQDFVKWRTNHYEFARHTEKLQQHNAEKNALSNPPPRSARILNEARQSLLQSQTKKKHALN
jgi:hypothetical protein